MPKQRVGDHRGEGRKRASGTGLVDVCPLAEVRDCFSAARRNVGCGPSHRILQITSAAGAGPVLVLNRLVLAGREAESDEARAEKRRRGGFRNGRDANEAIVHDQSIQGIDCVAVG